MIIVIIAGGSGTRLWPLSTPKFPKHLLALTGKRTLVQNAYDRASKIADDIYVVTEKGHADELKKQLPEMKTGNFIIEPARRGTANCLVVALDHIARRHNRDEPIAFIHADHHIRDNEGFARSFTIAAAASSERKMITLVGVEPTYPSTGFGYIEKSDPIRIDSIVHNVGGFTEKPDFKKAQSYMATGRYLWNCGYFVANLDIFLKAMKQHNQDLSNAFTKLQEVEHDPLAYEEAYLSFKTDTIDYALIEKVDNLLVVPATFDWMDVGSFKDLHEANAADESGYYAEGKAIHALEVENAYVRNEESKPLAIIGLDNIVVVNTAEGMLVARKDMSQRVGEIAKKIQIKK